MQPINFVGNFQEGYDNQTLSWIRFNVNVVNVEYEILLDSLHIIGSTLHVNIMKKINYCPSL